jgi:hypothetical protein
MWRLFGAVERIRSESGIDLTGATMESVEFRMPEIPPRDPDDLAAFEVGQRLTTDDAIALALGA